MNKLRLEMNNAGADGVPFFFMVDFELEKPLFYPIDELPGTILVDSPLFSNATKKLSAPRNISFSKQPVSYSKYKDAFDKVQKEIRYGNSYLVNLTFASSVDINLTLDEIFYISSAKYRLLFDGKFVVFSPEIFVRIENGRIYSNPMKGTIDASVENAERILMEDEKETAEHNTIVDLIRNDLSIISENVGVKKYRYIDRIETHERTLLQVSSEISGDLMPGWEGRLGDIILPLLPAGSVSGAPKDETLRIIRECEYDCRGYYTGVFGIFDGTRFDSAVMIRFIEQKEGKYVYRSGGGITYLSDPLKEYNELIAKVYVPFG